MSGVSAHSKKNHEYILTYTNHVMTHHRKGTVISQGLPVCIHSIYIVREINESQNRKQLIRNLFCFKKKLLQMNKGFIVGISLI